MDCSMPGFPVHHQLPELAQTHVHWVGDAIQPFHPDIPFSPAFNLSQHQGLFQWVSPSHQVAKVLQFFSFRISPSNKYSGLVSFRMDWLDLLAVLGTLKNLLQHHNSKTSILWCSALKKIFMTHITTMMWSRERGYMCTHSQITFLYSRNDHKSVKQYESKVAQSLWSHGLQHARPPCLSLTPRVYTNSCPLSQWCHPTISSSVSSSPPAFNLSQYQGVFHELALHITFSISPSNEYSGLISFRIDCFYLFAVQGTLKSLLQHHNSKTSTR